MTIVGNTLYAICDYTFEGNYIRTTPYVQTAILKQFLPDLKQDDKITIFLTEDAEKQNWDNRDFTEREAANSVKYGYRKSVEESVIKPGLKQELETVIKENVSADSFCAEQILNPVFQIPEGKTREELFALFEVIYNEIQNGDEIYFDITNSFRFMPMMVMTILNYAQTLKGIKVQGIYYGEYDPKAYDFKTNRSMPILDISMFQNIVDLAKASEVFVKNGIAEPLMEATKKSCNTPELSAIKNEMLWLDILTKEIQCGRGKYQDNGKKSIQTGYKTLKDKMVDLHHIEDGYSKIISPLMDYVHQNVSRFDTSNSVEIGLATVEWCIQYNQIQQGFTALEETCTTLACKLYEEDETDPDIREKVKGLMMKVASKNTLKLEKEAILKILPEKFIQLSANVSQQRNSINHFGYDKASENGTEFKTFHKTIKKFARELQEIYSSVQK